MRILLIYTFLLCQDLLSAQQLVLHPSTHVAGVEVILLPGYDADRSAHCFMEYKAMADAEWKSGIEADRVTISGSDFFKGSLFNLEPSTSYEVRCRLVDSIPDLDIIEFPVQFVTTKDVFVVESTTNIKWVSPNGSGVEYSEASPGKLTILLGSPIICGTTIMLMDGVYTEDGLSLTLTEDCSAEEPIVFIAAPGAEPVIDGGYHQPLVWNQNQSNPKLYSATLPEDAAYTNLCLLNGKMLYPYPSFYSNILVDTFSLAGLGFQYDGFIRDDKFITIHTSEGTDPYVSEVVLSKAFRFLTVYGNNHKAFLRFEGITINHFAKSNVPMFTLGHAATAFDIRNVHQVVFSNCRFGYNNFHLSFSGTCDDILIQGCSFKDETGLWSHGMIKKSVSDQSVFVPTSVARQFENGAVFLEDGKNITIRGNHFEGTCSGIVKQFENGIIHEADIYDNTFNYNFDAIECDGQWTNLRVWNNDIKGAMAGISMAPPLLGPRYFYRNTIHHMAGRQNIQNDPYYIGCSPPTDFRSAGIGIKSNSGALPDDRAGNVYFFNNTFHSDDTLGFTYTLWDSEWKEATFSNNIFYAEQNKIGYFQGMKDNTDFQLTSIHDNYFTADQSPIATIKEIHGQYTCHDVDEVGQLQNELEAISGSDHIIIESPFQHDPLFINTSSGDFILTAGSPMIDKGIQIPGFYDFIGDAPDLGAKESLFVSTYQPTPHPSHIQVYPNPTSGLVNVKFDKVTPLVQLSIHNILGQLVATSAYHHTDHIQFFLEAPPGNYFITIDDSGKERYVLKIVKW
jgi:hypothetical protein